MRKLLSTFFIILFCAFYACETSERNIIEISGFPISRKLVGSPVKELQLFKVKKLIVRDSILIILNREGDPFFQYYDLSGFQLIGKYGTEGKGPGEFLAPNLTGEHFKMVNGKTIMQIYDWKRKRINYIDLHESLINESYICESDLLPNTLVNTYNILIDNDSIIATIPDVDETKGRFVIYNKSRQTVSYIPFIPNPIKGKIHKKNVYMVFATNGYCVNSEEKYFIVAPNMIGRMDFFDFLGRFSKSLLLYDNKSLSESRTSKDIQMAEDIVIFQTDIQLVNNEIYSLYTLYKLPPKESGSNSKIFVFDHHGNPKIEYILDKRIDRFAVDTINQRFIGYSSEALNDAFISFSYK